MNSGNTLEINRIKEAYKERDGNLYPTSWKESIYHPQHPIGKSFYDHN